MVVLSFVKYSNIHNAINFTFSIPYHAYLDIFYRLLRTFSSGPLRFCQQKPFSSFSLLYFQLEKKGISFTDIEVEGEGVGLSMSIVEPPVTPGLSKETQKRLQKDLLSCKFRILRKGTRPNWIVEVSTLCQKKKLISSIKFKIQNSRQN